MSETAAERKRDKILLIRKHEFQSDQVIEESVVHLVEKFVVVITDFDNKHLAVALCLLQQTNNGDTILNCNSRFSVV